MTRPDDQNSEPAEQPTAEQPAAQQPTREQPTAEQAAAQQPTPEQPSAQQPAAEQPPFQPPYSYPFTPVPRPPKVPWIAPHRKAAVAGIAAAAALVCLGAGVGIGAAAFGNDNHHPVTRFERPGRFGQGPAYPRFPAPQVTPPSPSTSS